MKPFLFLSTVLAHLCLASFAQVTFPDPSSIATKADVQRAVSDLETKLRSEFAAGSPAQKDCQYALKLVEISKASTSGLEYNFYSQGVKNLIEVVYNSSGTELYQHRTADVSRDRIWLPYSLSPGQYKLKIANADCRAESGLLSFTIPKSAADFVPMPEPEPTGFVNPGVYVEKVGGRLYEWIPSEHLSVKIQNGKVKLIAPETKRSWNGNHTCRRFLFGDLYDNPLPDDEVNALFGEGLALAPGAYGFRIVYANAKNLQDLKERIWYVIGDGDGGGKDHSAQMETLQLSITEGAPIGAGIPVPSDLYRASWLPHYQLLPYNLNLPADKAFGTTRYVAGLPQAELFKKITHLQYRYAWLDHVPPDKKWNNLQAYNHQGKFVQPDWVVAHAPLDPNFITVAELAENYGNIENDCPRCYEKAEDVFRGIFQRYQTERGIRSPSQTRLYDDYFGALYGYSLEIPFTLAKVDLKKALGSVSSARQRYHEGSFKESRYFSAGAYEYRNYRLGGYIGNLFNTLPGTKFYGNLYNLEKVNLAIGDRNILKNGWQTAEAVGQDYVTGAGTFVRLKFETGDILRVEPNSWPVHTMIAESFFHLLLGNDYILWNSSLPMSSDLSHFTESWYGEYEPWKTKFQPAGGQAVTYDPNNPAHPQKKKSGDGGIFPEISLQGETGAFIGAWLYSQISGVSDRVSLSVKYCEFKVNGETFKPSKGSKGDGSLSSRISQNPGQDWIVTASEKNAPVCICTEGKDGKAVIYQNPNAGLTTDQQLVVSGRNFNITGNRLAIFYL